MRNTNIRQLIRSGSAGFALVAVSTVLITFVGCGPAQQKSEPAQEEGAMSQEPMGQPEQSGMGAGEPRIYFVTPKDGETVTSPVHVEFGAENFTIEPVGEGEIHSGAGHYHIGVNTDCLAPGTVIPKAAPWVHFGDGSNTIDLQLEPGETRLTLQVGDGEHRTLEAEGLCQTITVNVVDGGEASGDGSAAASD